jgi:hypothetical protein
VPVGFAYISPSSAFGSGLGFGIELMSGVHPVSLTRRDKADPDGEAHVPPLLLLNLGGSPIEEDDRNTVLAV